MSYRDIVLSITPFNIEKYSFIKSNVNLGAATAYYLNTKGVPLTMNYLGIAMYKMFPDKFACDEEFPEYPSLDRINREIMHMAIAQTKKDAAIAKKPSILLGSAKIGYKLTAHGEFIGKKTYEEILNGNKHNLDKPIKPIDSHKKGTLTEYTKIFDSIYFKNYLDSAAVPKSAVWKIYNVTPFTQRAFIQEKILLAKVKANELKDNKMLKFLEVLLKQID